ncbi:MAG: GAF domain-containing protein [Nitrospinae bacterium]|nr:GAF domain-containing protein [Nitrospinota bacterium]
MPNHLKESVQRLVELVSNTTEAFTAALFLLDDHHPGVLRLYAWHTLSQSLVTDATIPVGHGLVGWVAKNEKATHATRFERDTRAALRFYTIDEPIKSFAATPVRHGDRTIGVLAVDSKKQYVFTDKSLKLLDDFAVAIGRSLAMGRGRIKLREDAEAFEGVHGLMARLVGSRDVDEVSAALRLGLQGIVPHEKLLLALHDREDDLFRLHDPRGSGVEGDPVNLTNCRLGHVIGQQRVINMPSVGDARIAPGVKGEEWGSFLGAPMLVNNETVGAIGLFSRRPNAFTRAAELALFMVASTVASSFAWLRTGAGAPHPGDIDPVTGARTLSYALAMGKPFAGRGVVAVINPIGLLHVNAELGVHAGDAALLEVSRRLAAIAPESSLLVRPWGDRLALFVGKGGASDALALMRAAVRAIEEAPILVDGADIIMKACAGASLAPDDGVGAEELLIRAETACRMARRIVGERIALAGDNGALPELTSLKG